MPIVWKWKIYDANVRLRTKINCRSNQSQIHAHPFFQETMEKLPAEKKIEKCGKCSYKSSDKSNLSRHMKSVHKPCPYCEYENSSLNLDIHIKENHPDFDPIEYVPYNLTYECHKCSLHSVSKHVPRTYRDKHFKIYHGKCPICGYFTKDFKDNLNDHLLSVHPEKVSESNPDWIESRPKLKNAEVLCPHCPRFFKKNIIFKHSPPS